MSAKTKRPIGRPCELNEAVLEKAWLYLKGGYKEQGNAVPSVAGLAFALGKNRGTMYEWATQNDEFSNILECVATTQEMLLIDGGLNVDFNAAFAKMMMTKHGYSNKVEADMKSSDGSMTLRQITRVVIDPKKDDEPNH